MYNPYPYNLNFIKENKMDLLYPMYYDWCLSNEVEMRLNYMGAYHDFIHVMHNISTSPIDETRILILQREILGPYEPSLNELKGFWYSSGYNPFLWPSSGELQDCIDWFYSYNYNYNYFSKVRKKLDRFVRYLNTNKKHLIT